LILPTQPMVLIRDQNEERAARVDQMIEDLKHTRDAAERRIEHAHQTIKHSETTIARVEAALKRLKRPGRKQR
jgi:septal ring factor EnvC (AmiA/AmiB activator)